MSDSKDNNSNEKDSNEKNSNTQQDFEQAKEAVSNLLSGVGNSLTQKMKNLGNSTGEPSSSEADQATSSSVQEDFLGPKIPYLHGTEGEQKIAAGALFGVYFLMWAVMVGFGAGIAMSIISAFNIAIATAVLLITSRARVKFTNMTNCLNVIIISIFIHLLLWKIIGEALLDVEMKTMAKFVKDLNDVAFGVGIFNFTTFSLSFFGAGRLVWGRGFDQVWKAGTIVLIFVAVMYIIIFPTVAINMLNSMFASGGGTGGMSMPKGL